MIPNEQKPHCKRHDLLNSILGTKDVNLMKQSKQSPFGKMPRKFNTRTSESFGAPGSQFPTGKSNNPTPNFLNSKLAGSTSEYIIDQFEPQETTTVANEKQIFKSLKHQALLKIINNDNAALLQSVITKGRKTNNGSKGPKKSKNKKLTKSSSSTSDLHSFCKENEFNRLRPTSGGSSSNSKKNPKKLSDILSKNPSNQQKQQATINKINKKKLSASVNENNSTIAPLGAAQSKSVFDRLHQSKLANIISQSVNSGPVTGDNQALSPKWLEFKREHLNPANNQNNKLFYRPTYKHGNVTSPLINETRELKVNSKKSGVSEKKKSPPISLRGEQTKTDVKIEEFLKEQKGRQQSNPSMTPKIKKKSDEITFYTPTRRDRRVVNYNNNNNNQNSVAQTLDPSLNQYSSFNGKLTSSEIEKNLSMLMTLPVVDCPYTFFSDLQKLINEMALTNPDIAGSLIKMRICFEKLVTSIQQTPGLQGGHLQGPANLKNVKFQDEIHEESPAQKVKQHYFAEAESKSETNTNKILSGTSTDFTSKSRGIYPQNHPFMSKFAENKSTERTINSAFTTKREYLQNEENFYLKSQLVELKNSNNKLLDVIKRSMRIFGKLKAKGIDVERLFEKKMEVLLYQDVQVDYNLKEEKLSNLLLEYEKSVKKDEGSKKKTGIQGEKEALGLERMSNQFSGGSVAEFKTQFSGSERKAADRYNKSDDESNKEDFILNKLEQRFYQGPFAVRPSHVDRHMESYS